MVAAVGSLELTPEHFNMLTAGDLPGLFKSVLGDALFKHAQHKLLHRYDQREMWWNWRTKCYFTP